MGIVESIENFNKAIKKMIQEEIKPLEEKIAQLEQLIQVK